MLHVALLGVPPRNRSSRAERDTVLQRKLHACGLCIIYERPRVFYMFLHYLSGMRVSVQLRKERKKEHLQRGTPVKLNLKG